MNFKILFKNKAIIIAIISFTLGALIYNYSMVFFQEDNPWPQIKGIIQLNFGNKDLVKLDDGGNKYITKSDNPEIIKSFMKNRNYDFTEQMGSNYLFKSDVGASAVATHRYYSRYYSLWSIAENLITKDTSLADELKKCLPKSDIASHQRCSELLAMIKNFADCVNAGFSVIKSDPPQCVTLDGRNFTDKTN